jgi:hypothetical protein
MPVGNVAEALMGYACGGQPSLWGRSELLPLAQQENEPAGLWLTGTPARECVKIIHLEAFLQRASQHHPDGLAELPGHIIHVSD